MHKELCIHEVSKWNNFAFIRDSMKTITLNKLIYHKQVEVLNYTKDIIEIMKNNNPLCAKDIIIGTSSQSK